MRVLIHDFAGHPSQVQLSRILARRGHTVLYVYYDSLSSMQQAKETHEDDPDTFKIRGLALDKPINKQAFVTRWRRERAYGHLAAGALRDFLPDVVLSATTPLSVQRRLLDVTREVGARFVYWVQDLTGRTAERLIEAKVPMIGGAAGSYYAKMERTLLAESEALVLVSEDLYEAIPEIRRHPSTHVIPNWAPLDAIPVRPRDNAWVRAQDFHEGSLRFVYAGTLGLKHNPRLLLNLAHRIPHEVIVISQGAGIDWLREQKEIENVKNLRLLPFQPFEDLPDVLGAADVLLAIPTPDAGVFSVPSKVLTYLCASRPLLLAGAPSNQAVQIVEEHEAGLVVKPNNNKGFLEAGAQLARDVALRETMGANARAYAEQHFGIEPIADRFEAILTGSPPPIPPPPDA